MIRIAVVEDESQCREQFCGFINRFARETDTSVQISTFENGLQLVNNYKPEFDVIFLDIQMPVFDGLETAQHIRKIDQEVILIFVTNMAQYAIKGYAVNAYDFIVKPVAYPAFEQKLRKVVHILEKRPSQYVILSTSNGMFKVDSDDIYYFEVLNHTILCHTTQGVQRLSSGTLTALETKLAPVHFSRCNSGYLVNLRHVTTIQRDCVVVGKSTVPISRPRKKMFLKALTEYVGG